MALVKIRWEVTEVHSKTIEIDDFDEDDLDDSLLAEQEDGDSWDATTDRTLLEYDVVREGNKEAEGSAST